jgi:serine/threonine protein phosphatase PrpC
MSAVQAVADDSGATALVAVLVERTAPLRPELWIANAGDCRALIRRAGHAVQLTNDHCGANAAEAERLCLDGVSLARTPDGKLRVHGLIEVTRSIGDRCHSSRIASVREPLLTTAQAGCRKDVRHTCRRFKNGSLRGLTAVPEIHAARHCRSAAAPLLCTAAAVAPESAAAVQMDAHRLFAPGDDRGE